MQPQAELMFYLGYAGLAIFVTAVLVREWQKKLAEPPNTGGGWLVKYGWTGTATFAALACFLLIWYGEPNPADLDNNDFVEVMEPREDFQEAREANEAAVEALTNEEREERREQAEAEADEADEAERRRVEDRATETVTDGDFRRNILNREAPTDSNAVMSPTTDDE